MRLKRRRRPAPKPQHRLGTRVASNPKDLKDLQAEWYAKAKEAGFKDIESQLTDRLSSSINQRLNPLWEVKQEYYRKAGWFVYEYQFADEFDRIVWTYHAEGISVRNIVDLLKKAGLDKKRPVYRGRVWLTINRLRKKMNDLYAAESNAN